MNRTTSELDKLAQRLDLNTLDQALFFPKYIELETVSLCNARCIMCPVRNRKDKPRFLSEELFSKFVEEIKVYATWLKKLCICRDGEPLLDQGLEEKIRRLKEVGLNYITFSTNASLLTEDRTLKLLESGLDEIMISIDALNKETYESIRVGLSYESVMENILRFVKIRDTMKEFVPIKIRMVGMEENKTEWDSWIKYWKNILTENDIVVVKALHSWGNQLGKTDRYYRTRELPTPCISLWSTVIIHTDGIVPLCATDYNRTMIMGDFSRQTIKEIWSNEMFQQIRRSHMAVEKDLLSLCNKCAIWHEDNAYLMTL